jgi:hypothetical protein
VQPDHVNRQESETYDIYLVPPNEDPETCQSWLRMRYRDGRYNLMFEEWVVDVSAAAAALRAGLCGGVGCWRSARWGRGAGAGGAAGPRPGPTAGGRGGAC